MDRPLFVIRGMFAHSTIENPLIVFADHIIGVSNGKVCIITIHTDAKKLKVIG